LRRPAIWLTNVWVQHPADKCPLRVIRVDFACPEYVRYGNLGNTGPSILPVEGVGLDISSANEPDSGNLEINCVLPINLEADRPRVRAQHVDVGTAIVRKKRRSNSADARYTGRLADD
jgi:hypothetical protein